MKSIALGLALCASAAFADTTVSLPHPNAYRVLETQGQGVTGCLYVLTAEREPRFMWRCWFDHGGRKT